mmetsp:Transcript_18365/g.34888  ORF Transcript_18365/g.34888 Transcript_18365/m.34888 type:complete len:80 (+) Transcript_18365:553-792(+)
MLGYEQWLALQFLNQDGEMAETPSTPKSKAFSQDTLGSFSAGTGSLGVGDPHVFDSGSTSISTAVSSKKRKADPHVDGN